MNTLMEIVLKVLNDPKFTHGKPRHPQTQGLIERANSTVKRKTQMKARDLGFTTYGQLWPWLQDLQSIIDNENDACVKLYRYITPFVALHGRPRLCGGMVPPTDGDTRRMHEYMCKCQDARAFKRNQYPAFVQLKVGDVVNVRATPKELKDHIALAPWSAKGVVHAMSTYSMDVFSVRWLTLATLIYNPIYPNNPI